MLRHVLILATIASLPNPGRAENSSAVFLQPELVGDGGLLPTPPVTSPADEVDLSIKSIRAVGTDVSLKPAYSGQHERLEDPRDFSLAFTAAEPIFYESRYGPNWLAHNRFAVAAGSCHRPLYFEELNLERYGNSIPLMHPLISGAHFYGTVLALPYLATVEKPWVCYAPEPWYPPAGVEAPWQPAKRYPFRLDAATAQAATVTGLILLLP